MNDLLREWIEKAEGDVHTAEREFRVTRKPNYDAVCFHAQQAVEKYLKALLQNKSIPIPRSHDLVYLTKLLGDSTPQITVLSDSLNRLTAYATESRYPGEQANKKDAQESVKTMRLFRKIFRSILNI